MTKLRWTVLLLGVVLIGVLFLVGVFFDEIASVLTSLTGVL
jgi:hypothetical protein